VEQYAIAVFAVITALVAIGYSTKRVFGTKPAKVWRSKPYSGEYWIR
jgi:hypothetical protein